MLRIVVLLAAAFVVAACASVSRMPQSASEVAWDAAIGDTGWAEWQEDIVVVAQDQEQLFRAARDALADSSFLFLRGSASEGFAIGERGMTLYDWNVVAGVYFRPLGDDEGSYQIRVIAEGSKDIGFSGDTTGANWPHMIASALQQRLTPRAFGQHPELDGRQGSSTGTGFAVGDGALIVTAYHVVEGANEITVTTITGERLVGRIRRSNPDSDFALIEIDGRIPPLLTAAGSPRLGQEIFVLGYPVPEVRGRELSVTFGDVNSTAGIGGDPRFFQLDAGLQPGNSGGPILNVDGLVVGIVLSRLSDIYMLRETGSLPQNVNYGLKLEFISEWLPPSMQPVPQFESREDLIEQLSGSVVLVTAKRE